MKSIIIGCCILLCFPLFGQGKKKIKQEQYVHIQGAFFYDSNLDVDYTGFNLVNIGWTKYKAKRAQSLELEFIGFKADGDEIISPFGLIPESTRTKRSLELIYSRTYAILGTASNGFYIGPTASLNLNYDFIAPNTTGSFPINSISTNIGFGIKTGYNWKITKRILFNLSTRLTMFDTGLESLQIENPNLPIALQTSTSFQFDLIRDHFPLMFGFSYKL